MRWGKCHKQLKLWREGGREGADPQNCTRLWDECRSSFGLAVHATYGRLGGSVCFGCPRASGLPPSKDSTLPLRPHMTYYDTPTVTRHSTQRTPRTPRTQHNAHKHNARARLSPLRAVL